MPRAFNSHESDRIRDAIRACGRDLFARRGVLATTIAQLASAAGIAKGSFYKFYPGKEALFLDLLEEAHEALRTPLTIPVSTPGRAELAAKLAALLKQSFEDPLISILSDKSEADAILRRVPADRLAAHQETDRAFIERLIAAWAQDPGAADRTEIAARMTTAAMVCMNRKLFGDALFARAFAAAVESLVDCFFPRDSG
ncbi:TetR/AcrR family transcriptional regulator [Hyphobacterium sp.]|uniref:TetR/AcrR family transcriptional regulator n=1 Tax=Hyphobacterium sp. TaxID=2004662 RepID=UPI003B52628F